MDIAQVDAVLRALRSNGKDVAGLVEILRGSARLNRETRDTIADVLEGRLRKRGAPVRAADKHADIRRYVRTLRRDYKLTKDLAIKHAAAEFHMAQSSIEDILDGKPDKKRKRRQKAKA